MYAQYGFIVACMIIALAVSMFGAGIEYALTLWTRKTLGSQKGGK